MSLKAGGSEEPNSFRHISWCRAQDDSLGLNVIEARIVQLREGGVFDRSRLDHQAVDSFPQVVKIQVGLVPRGPPGRGANSSTEIRATYTNRIFAKDTSQSMMFILDNLPLRQVNVNGEDRSTLRRHIRTPQVCA